MPRMRKLSPEEVLDLEQRERTPRIIPRMPEELPLLEYDPGAGAVVMASDAPVAGIFPRIGDVLRLRSARADEGPIGIMVSSRSNEAGNSAAAEVLIDGRRYLVPYTAIERVMGRPRGISRIDQPSHRTHGWFVRLYEGHTPRLSRFFSDRTYGGIAAALKEALAFHAAEDRPRADYTQRRRSVKMS